MSAPSPRTLVATAITCVGLAAAVAPATASASTVGFAPDGALVYTAAPGELNSVGIQSGNDDATLTIYDGDGSITSPTPPGCTTYDATKAVTCPLPPLVRLDLGDGKDWGYVSNGVPVPSTLLGGDGDDTLAGNEAPQTIDGGAGTDKIAGAQGADVLRGGDGNDSVDGGEGADQVEGGAGDDLMAGDHYEGQFSDVIDGGPGFDRIEADWGDRHYDYVQPPVAISLGGGADDGRPGENDDVRGIEKVAVNIPGTYTGTDAAETLEVHQVLGTVTLDGRGGNDTLIGADGQDAIDGGAGDDTIDAGFGDDTITPGPGKDVVAADRRGGDCGPLWCKYPYGNDTVNAVDGEVDSIFCGAGEDRVVADPADVVAPDCETVERQGAAVPGGSVGGSGVPGGSSGAGASGATLAAKPTSTSKALRSGLSVKLTGLPARKRIKLSASVNGKAVASGSAKASRSGRATVVLRFSKAGKRLVRGRSKLTLVITGAGIPATTVVLRGSR